MRARPCIPGALCAFVCSLIVALATPAQANVHEVVFAINETQLHKRPGEAAPVVGHADQGDELEVLGDQGRWLRVRNGKQVGWVARTEVAATKPAGPRPHAERSGFSGKPVADAVKVTIDIDRVRGYDDPRTKGKAVLDLVRGDVVAMLGRGYNGWILVEPEDGPAGWIPDSAVKDAGNFAGDPRQTPAELAKVGSAAPVPAPMPVTTEVTRSERRVARQRVSATLMATAGAQTFKMQQSGSGDGTAIATGELATIAAEARMRLRQEIWAGLATSAELGAAGLTYYGGTETSPSMSTRELAVDTSAELGWGSTSQIVLRGGVHYATLSVTSDRTEPMLLGERIAGATFGLGGAVPLGRRLMLSAAVDVMPAGAQKMSKLPAGTLYATAVRGAWARGTLAMPLPAHLVAALSYRFGALSADLTDGAAMPKTASRSDQSHVVTAGVGVAW